MVKLLNAIFHHLNKSIDYLHFKTKAFLMKITGGKQLAFSRQLIYMVAACFLFFTI